MDLLVTNVAELLTAAVQEVLQLMGQAVLEYQREFAKTRLENHKLQQKLRELQERNTKASDEVLNVSFPRDESHLKEDQAQEDLHSHEDSAPSEETKQPECLTDEPAHISLVLDEIPINSRHHSLQTTCDYSFNNQRPLSRVKTSSSSRISNSSSGSRKTPAVETPQVSNTIKLESKPEPLECPLTGDAAHVPTLAPVVPVQDAPFVEQHIQQPASSIPNIIHFSQPHKPVSCASKHVLRSRVENMVDAQGGHSAVSTSESREMLHSCHVCGKTFASPSSLGAHFVCHSNERPFGCKYCKFRFSRLADLKKHERIHTGEKPYNCSLCGRRFNRTENLKRHLRKVHYGAAL
ncbi:zinc finger protein 260 [Danio aesculapii]|uniref:zinc finger protein 260 n=1 Tax=Danio aesculapii TaxID=1142201 RepID=UPI0024C0B199|nr:zinc finger protein 260 [Danio aesculapii]